MNGFKLIAIKTPKTCNIDGKDFLKVLSPNTIYSFYQAYSFLNNDFGNINYDANNDLDIYSSNQELKINVSAIVGSNGSGKSTLLELFLMANYNLGAFFKMLTECTCEDDEIEKGDCDCSKEINQEILESKKDFSLEILYSKNNNDLILLEFKEGHIKKYMFSNEGSKYVIGKPQDFLISDLGDFCYSIMVNYSHYALNAREIGEWINPLFHKNDGYQTPVVINPMRKDGNIDINTENELLKDRLMSNLFEPIDNQAGKINSLRNVANNKIADRLKVAINKEKVAKNHYFHLPDPGLSKKEDLESAIEDGLWKANKYLDDDSGFIKAIDEVFNLNLKILDINDPFIIWGINYFFIKINSLKADYNPMKNLSLFSNSTWQLQYFNFLKEDKSHVAFKLKRVIYFLKYYEEFWKDALSKNKEINIDLISEIIVKIKEHENSENLKTIELIFPSYLNIDIILNNNSLFSDLSSGEKHKIYTISSIVYHIVNINSISSQKIKYSHINVILDEIELYFHPEWQRVYITDLLSYINKINNIHLKTIKGINIMFVTHSPFIISDIPKQKTLLLKITDNLSLPEFSKRETFGANIHDLLIDNFFMTSTIGEYAKGKINEFVTILNKAIRDRKEDRTRLLKASRIELENLGGKKFIELIGDSLVKDKLLQLYFLATEDNDNTAMKRYYEMKLNELNN